MKLNRKMRVTALLCLATQASFAQVKIGVTLSSTGPAASLGIPEKQAVLLMPKKLGGLDVDYIILDDASDATTARKNMLQFTTQDHVDAIIGSSTTPATLANLEVAGESRTPLISLGAASSIVEPMDANRRWVFKTPYNDSTTAKATVADMQKKQIKSVAFIGADDGYGESWLKELKAAMAGTGMVLVAQERFASRDSSVVAQVLKVLAAKPDTVLIAASGTPSAAPEIALRDRGFKGIVYQTTGVLNQDFIRVGGKSVEGTLVAGAPVTVSGELPDTHPAKRSAATLAKKWENAYGTAEVNAFGGYAWDAYLLLDSSVAVASRSAKPGTAEFRTALRDALERCHGVATTDGVVNMSETDHNGYAPDAPSLLIVRNGGWHLAK
jgi:branched-chain amino acid transport system substrate-binding protein